MRSALWLTTSALIFLSGAAFAQDNSVGRTSVVVAQVEGALQQRVRQLVVKDDVHQDERITTHPQSASEVVFFDGTVLAVGENSNVVLTKYIYDPRPTGAALTLNAVKGLFRFATGSFNKEAYKIDTPLATIGVRGTDFECNISGGGEQPREETCRVTSGLITMKDNNGVVHEVPAGSFGTIDDKGFKLGDTKNLHDAAFESFGTMIRDAKRDGTPNLGIPHQFADNDWGTSATGHRAVSGEPREIVNVNGVNVLKTIESGKFVSPTTLGNCGNQVGSGTNPHGQGNTCR